MPDVQLAEMVTPDDIPDYADWWAERKLDGVRCLARDGRLFTRSGNDITDRFPEVEPPEAHTFDGELITTDLEFDTTLRRVQTEKPFKVDLLSRRYPARLIVFDVLDHNGTDVRERPLSERRELLEPSIPSDAGLYKATVHDDPMALWDEATGEGWEGIMLKDPEATYRGKRTGDWLKVKDWKEDTFPVIEAKETDNEGFVVVVGIGGDQQQRVVVNGEDDQRQVQDADQVRVQFLERSTNWRLRKPSYKGVA